MKRTTILLSAGLAGLLAGLVAHFPASHAIGVMAPSGVTAEGVRGSIWHGSARRVELGGPAPLAAVTWELSAVSLLGGRLGLETGFEIAGGRTTFTASVAPGGEVTITDAIFRGPAASLTALLPRPMSSVPVAGEVIARLDGARWADGRLRDISARVLWEDARLREPGPVALGNVTAEARPAADGSHRIDIDNRDSPLAIDGEGRVDADGRYEIVVRLEAGADTPAGIRDLLETYAERDNGDFVVRASGRIPFR